MQPAIRNKGGKPVSPESLDARLRQRKAAEKIVTTEKMDRDYEKNRLAQARSEQQPAPGIKGDDSDFSQFGELPSVVHPYKSDD
jgi:hypothetical protein